ncbi:uncharacterized protein [Hetaerina americana]|uniref:uncharacterized protein n=1 Tax=Hetaerina americana TaxID=62018 RepID=UPI003A7F5862
MCDEAEFEVCRLCLNSRGLLMNVFGENSKLQFKLEKTIEDLIDVKVVEDASYPWLVCSNCMEKLTEFRLFKRRCAECLCEFYNRIQKECYPERKDVIPNRHEFPSEIKKDIDDDTIINDAVDSSAVDVRDDMIIVKMEVDASSGFSASSINDIGSSMVPSMQEGCSLSSDNKEEVSLANPQVDESHLSFNEEVIIKVERDVDDPQKEGCMVGDVLKLQDGAQGQVGEDKDVVGNLLHTCQICNQVFKQLELLEAHRMCEHLKEGKQVNCDVCSMTFGYQNELNKHVKSVHTMKKKHQCQECSKYFKNQSELRTHMMRHTGEKPIKCKICSKGFAKNGHLNKHMVIHSDEKPYKCEICLKGFKVSGNLKKHHLVHTGERPYKCEICLKSFSQKVSLKGHMLTHTDERPFKCEICSKCFRTTFNLKDHLLTHTDEKPHKCEVCSKGFRLKQHLHNHMSTHGSLPYKRIIVKKLYIKKH